MIAWIRAAATSLPDRDYYFKDDAKSREIREEFQKHVTKMLGMLGDPPKAAASGAKTVMAFETALAEAAMTNVQLRDPYATYHKMDLAGLTALYLPGSRSPASSRSIGRPAAFFDAIKSARETTRKIWPW